MCSFICICNIQELFENPLSWMDIKLALHQNKFTFNYISHEVFTTHFIWNLLFHPIWQFQSFRTILAFCYADFICEHTHTPHFFFLKRGGYVNFTKHGDYKLRKKSMHVRVQLSSHCQYLLTKQYGVLFPRVRANAVFLSLCLACSTSHGDLRFCPCCYRFFFHVIMFHCVHTQHFLCSFICW